MRRLTEVVVGALLCGVLVAGCGNGSEETDTGPEFDSSPSPSQSDAASSLPQGVPTEPPGAPADMNRKTNAAAKEFSQYAAKLFWYAIATNDIQPLMAIAQERTCKGCSILADNLAETSDEYQVPNGPLQFKSFVILAKEGDIWHVGLVYDVPPGQEIYRDGRDPADVNPVKNDYMELDLVWKGDRWLVGQVRRPKQ